MSPATLRKSEWRQYYQYKGPAFSAEHFECIDAPAVLMFHSRWRGRKYTQIQYWFNGKWYESLIAVSKAIKMKPHG